MIYSFVTLAEKQILIYYLHFVDAINLVNRPFTGWRFVVIYNIAQNNYRLIVKNKRLWRFLFYEKISRKIYSY